MNQALIDNADAYATEHNGDYRTLFKEYLEIYNKGRNDTLSFVYDWLERNGNIYKQGAIRLLIKDLKNSIGE